MPPRVGCQDVTSRFHFSAIGVTCVCVACLLDGQCKKPSSDRVPCQSKVLSKTRDKIVVVVRRPRSHHIDFSILSQAIPWLFFAHRQKHVVVFLAIACRQNRRSSRSCLLGRYSCPHAPTICKKIYAAEENDGQNEYHIETKRARNNARQGGWHVQRHGSSNEARRLETIHVQAVR